VTPLGHPESTRTLILSPCKVKSWERIRLKFEVCYPSIMHSPPLCLKMVAQPPSGTTFGLWPTVSQTHTQPYTTLHQPESLGTRHALQWPIPLIGPSPLPSRQRRIVGSRPGARVWRRHEAQPLVDGNNRLQIARLYKAITTSAPSTCNFAKFAWENHAPHPPRARLFAWLLVQQRINYKSNLHIKAIIEDSSCDLCRQDVETPDHHIFGCTFT
jgi:hypothetical protein